MASLTLDALLRGLKKGAPDPVYLLHGDEDVLKAEAVRALLDATVDPAARDFNLDSRFAADLDAETFNALVNTPPMLAERRAVVLRGVDQIGKRKSKLRDELVHYLGAPNPTTVLVLVAGAEIDAELGRGGTSVAVEALAPERGPGRGRQGGAGARAGRHERRQGPDPDRHPPRGHRTGARRARPGSERRAPRGGGVSAPAGGPALRPTQLQGRSGALGAVERAVDRDGALGR